MDPLVFGVLKYDPGGEFFEDPLDEAMAFNTFKLSETKPSNLYVSAPHHLACTYES